MKPLIQIRNIHEQFRLQKLTTMKTSEGINDRRARKLNIDIPLNNKLTENLHVDKDKVISLRNTGASRSRQQNDDTEVEYMNSTKNKMKV